MKKGAVGVCLIDNDDHFKENPPSVVELHALENVLLQLLNKADQGCNILLNPGLSLEICPAAARSLQDVIEKAHRRKNRIRHSESNTITVDLGPLFRSGQLDYSNPEGEVRALADKKVTRLVFRYHGSKHPYENLPCAKAWTEAAHHNNIDLLLYTGPFGAEYHDLLKDVPESESWLQRTADGVPATYDDGGYLLMFCPSSPYLSTYGLPIILEFLGETGCDGLFFDIPWLASGACHCENCRTAEAAFPSQHALQFKEHLVREGLSDLYWLFAKPFPMPGWL